MSCVRRWGAAVILLGVLASCSSSSSRSPAATPVTPIPNGGTLVLGLEQEPDCLDWIGSCTGVAYGYWAANVTTVPRAYSIEKVGDGWAYKATSLLAGEPTVVTAPKQVVTYRINPKAVWSDGRPITSHDFKYTWDQVAHDKDVNDRTGYDVIEGVDDTDPHTVVVTFSKPFPDWKADFGGSYGVLPAHLLEGKDRDQAMAEGYSWSGGPWKIESWQKGQQLSLVPNDAYWGPKPKLDKVVFKFTTDTAQEYDAFKAGEVQGIYPQPQLDIIDKISAGTPGTRSQYSADTANAEGLWMNHGKAPFDDTAFRKAVSFAVDRDAVVKRLFGKLGIERAMQTLTPPILKKFADPAAFAQYKLDLAQVDKLMTGAGWRKGKDGIWARGAQRASFSLKTVAGNQRRELTAQIVQDQLKTAGFEMTIDEQKGGDLTGTQLPHGDFQLLLLKFGLTSFYPAGCNIFCSKNIPTEATKFSGGNWFRVNDPKVDSTYGLVETTLDEAKAAELNRQGDDALAAGAHYLPLDPLPNILLTSNKVVGPVQDNPVMGPFWNLYAWGLKQ